MTFGIGSICPTHALNVGLVISLGLLAWSVLTTRVEHVEPGIVSMLLVLPGIYWVGILALAFTTYMWSVLGLDTKHYIFVVLLWVGYFFVGPEFMEAYPRSPTTYDHAWGVQLLRTGLIARFLYPYHGLQYLFAMAFEVMGGDYFTSIRFGVLTIYAALFTTLAMFLARVQSRRRLVLGMLVAVAMFSVTGITFSPGTLGLAVGLICLCSVRMDGQGKETAVPNIAVPIIAYSVLPALHGLTSLVVIYVLAVSALFMRFQRRQLAWRSLELRLALLMAATLLMWHMYRGQLFGFIVTSLRDSVIRERAFAYYAIYHVSLFREQRSVIALLTLLFIAVLGIWVLVALLETLRRKQLTLFRIFPLVAAAGLPLVIFSSGNFSYEVLVRAYFYAVPLVSLFLASEVRSKGAAFLFLPVLLSLGFVLLYSREFEELPPKTEIIGASFVQRTSNDGDSLLSAECLSIGSVTGLGPYPAQRCIATVSNLARELPNPHQFTYIVVSEFGRETTSFLMGEQRWSDFSAPVRLGFSRFYSNGSYDVYRAP